MYRRSLQRTRYTNIEILIVDNGSTDARALALLAGYAALGNCRVIRDDSPFNYSALNNKAAALARGSLLCLLNNDIDAREPEWLSILCGYALQPGVGAVGAALWYPNERLQHGGVALAGEAVAGHFHHMLGRDEAGYFGRALLAQRVAAVTGMSGGQEGAIRSGRWSRCREPWRRLQRRRFLPEIKYGRLS